MRRFHIALLVVSACLSLRAWSACLCSSPCRVVDVRQNCMAVGDGVADDSSAIQDAFSAVSSPGTIVFPAGTYKLGSAVSATPSRLTVRFQGATLLNGTSAPGALTLIGSHLTFEGAVVLDHAGRSHLGLVTLSACSDVAWTAQTQIVNGGNEVALHAYAPVGASFENLYSDDSMLIGVNTPRQLRLANLRARLKSTATLAKSLVAVHSNQNIQAGDITLTDVDLDLGGRAVTSAVVIGPNLGLPNFDGVKVTNLTIRNNAAFPATPGGDGIDILRSDNVDVENVVLRDLNINGIVVLGNNVTLSNIVGQRCGAPCVQVHDPAPLTGGATAHYSGAVLSNVVVVDGGLDTANSSFHARAGIAIAPPAADGSQQIVKLENVHSFGSPGSAQQWGLAISRNVTSVIFDGSHLAGSLGTVRLEDDEATTLATDGQASLILNNAYWNGAAWNRYDKNSGASFLGLDTLGRMALYGIATGGTGPIGWTNNFSVDSDGALQWAGGAAIKKHLSGTFALDLGTPASVPGCVQALVSLSGAAPGDTLAVGSSAAIPATQQIGAVVTGSGQIAVRVCQFSGAAADPDGGGATYRVDAWQH